jgi:hypothetical protein
MVCPREDYSAEALQALADSGRFLGVVNTACIPRDLDSKQVRGSDLLRPALDAFSGFPIFKRYYWSDISVFAMAKFLGKPAILVEHHDFFKDQHRALKDFVNQLVEICPAVSWPGLTDLARTTCRRRRVTPETLEIEFFTNEFLMQNPDPESRIVRFRKRVPASAVIEAVEVNGTQVAFERNGDAIRFETKLPGGATAEVQVHRRAIPQRGAVSRGRLYRVQVAFRRFFSEFRDHRLSRSPTVLRLANKLMQALRLRGTK